MVRWLLLLPLVISCSLSQDLVTGVPDKPDYSSLDSWLAHPEKLDLSDSIYLGEVKNQFGIPVFFVSPTVYFPKKGGSWNLDVNTATGKELFDRPITYQSTAFNIAGDVYSPAYRQSAYQVYLTAPSTVTKRSYDIAYQDVRSAFQAFLTQIGAASPFILAAHSQGTDHLIRLIKEDFPRELHTKLVAAYLVGMPVDTCDFPLPICENSSSTGCFTSWRTYHIRASIANKYPEECIGVVNPLSWTTEKDYVGKEHNVSVFISTDKPLRDKLVSAEISEGVVKTEKPDIPGKLFIRTTNYHRGDINLYYGNIQQNVKERCLSYLKER